MNMPSQERIAELKELAIEHLGDAEHFDYHHWDGLIECDETLTDEELDWMRKNFEVVISIKKKDS